MVAPKKVKEYIMSVLSKQDFFASLTVKIFDTDHLNSDFLYSIELTLDPPDIPLFETTFKCNLDNFEIIKHRINTYVCKCKSSDELVYKLHFLQYVFGWDIQDHPWLVDLTFDKW